LMLLIEKFQQIL